MNVFASKGNFCLSLFRSKNDNHFAFLQVRSLTNMCSAPLDLFSMLELGGQQPSNAMVAMNQVGQP
jgi:hypothetical protein